MKHCTQFWNFLSGSQHTAKILKTASLTLLISVLGVARASATEMIYNAYGNEGNGYDPYSGYTVEWYDNEMEPERINRMGNKYAFQFTAGTCMGQWTMKELTITGNYQDATNLVLSIVMDNGNLPTGEVMCSVTNPPQIQATLGTATIPISGTLQSGGTYWLVCAPQALLTKMGYFRMSTTLPNVGGNYCWAYRNSQSGDWNAWPQASWCTAQVAFNIKGVSGSAPVITAFQNNSTITWADGITNGVYTVEWAAEAAGPWHRTWTALMNINSSSATNIAVVPRFYRVTRDRVQ